MSFFTLSAKIKSFSVAAFLLVGSLLAINYGFTADFSKDQPTDGDSVKALRRIYSSVTKAISPIMTTADEKQHVENKEGHFLKQDAKNQAGM